MDYQLWACYLFTTVVVFIAEAKILIIQLSGTQFSRTATILSTFGGGLKLYRPGWTLLCFPCYFRYFFNFGYTFQPFLQVKQVWTIPKSTPYCSAWNEAMCQPHQDGVQSSKPPTFNDTHVTEFGKTTRLVCVLLRRTQLITLNICWHHSKGKLFWQIDVPILKTCLIFEFFSFVAARVEYHSPWSQLYVCSYQLVASEHHQLKLHGHIRLCSCLLTQWYQWHTSAECGKCFIFQYRGA